MTLTDALTRNLALQILISRNHLPPSPQSRHFDVLQAAWTERYTAALATARQMLAASDLADEEVSV